MKGRFGDGYGLIESRGAHQGAHQLVNNEPCNLITFRVAQHSSSLLYMFYIQPRG